MPHAPILVGWLSGICLLGGNGKELCSRRPAALPVAANFARGRSRASRRSPDRMHHPPTNLRAHHQAGSTSADAADNGFLAGRRLQVRRRCRLLGKGVRNIAVAKHHELGAPVDAGRRRNPQDLWFRCWYANRISGNDHSCLRGAPLPARKRSAGPRRGRAETPRTSHPTDI